MLALQDLFRLKKEDTYESRMEFFGPVFEKSVLEAMGSTGIIAPDYRKSIDKLRERLGLSEASAKQLYLAAIEEKMKPMVEWIVSEMERTMLTQQQLSQRRKKDMGEDMFQTGKGADVSVFAVVAWILYVMIVCLHRYLKLDNIGCSRNRSGSKSHERYNEFGRFLYRE